MTKDDFLALILGLVSQAKTREVLDILNRAVTDPDHIMAVALISARLHILERMSEEGSANAEFYLVHSLQILKGLYGLCFDKELLSQIKLENVAEYMEGREEYQRVRKLGSEMSQHIVDSQFLKRFNKDKKSIPEEGKLLEFLSLAEISLIDLSKAWSEEYGNSTLQKMVRTFLPYIKPEMVSVEGGAFLYQKGGWNPKTSKFDLLGTKQKVRSFLLGKYPVTFEEYDAFCEATNSKKPDDEGWGRDRRPVILVSWYDAATFCNWLSEQEGLERVYTISEKDVSINSQADGYRLPTEIEWEFAAKGGNKSQGYKFSGSDNLDEVAWYSGNSERQTHPVGQKNPNELGIYDMSGNVWEWCQNSSGSDMLTHKVRGGSWYNYNISLRVAYRLFFNPDNRYSAIGFRLCRY